MIKCPRDGNKSDEAYRKGLNSCDAAKAAGIGIKDIPIRMNAKSRK